MTIGKPYPVFGSGGEGEEHAKWRASRLASCRIVTRTKDRGYTHHTTAKRDQCLLRCKISFIKPRGRTPLRWRCARLEKWVANPTAIHHSGTIGTANHTFINEELQTQTVDMFLECFCFISHLFSPVRLQQFLSLRFKFDLHLNSNPERWHYRQLLEPGSKSSTI